MNISKQVANRRHSIITIMHSDNNTYLLTFIYANY